MSNHTRMLISSCTSPHQQISTSFDQLCCKIFSKWYVHSFQLEAFVSCLQVSFEYQPRLGKLYFKSNLYSQVTPYFMVWGSWPSLFQVIIYCLFDIKLLPNAAYYLLHHEKYVSMKFDLKVKHLIQEDAFRIAICEMRASLFRWQYVKTLFSSLSLHHYCCTTGLTISFRNQCWPPSTFCFQHSSLPLPWASVHWLVQCTMECHWLTQCTMGYHWATQRILAGCTGTPLEKLSWNSPTLECHWRNLAESAPHWNATGKTLTFAAYTGTLLEGLWQPTHTPTHLVKHSE